MHFDFSWRDAEATARQQPPEEINGVNLCLQIYDTYDESSIIFF